MFAQFAIEPPPIMSPVGPPMRAKVPTPPAARSRRATPMIAPFMVSLGRLLRRTAIHGFGTRDTYCRRGIARGARSAERHLTRQCGVDRLREYDGQKSDDDHRGAGHLTD